MSWREFSYLISGLTAKTPLGMVVSIRAEEDPDVIKNFSRDEKRIRNEYQKKLAKSRSNDEVTSAINSFKDAFIKLAGGIQDEET